MDKVYIRELHKESPYWDKIEELFVQLYDYMEARGILMPLVENGEKMWLESLKKTSGRFSVLNVAIRNKYNWSSEAKALLQCYANLQKR